MHKTNLNCPLWSLWRTMCSRLAIGSQCAWISRSRGTTVSLSPRWPWRMRICGSSTTSRNSSWRRTLETRRRLKRRRKTPWSRMSNRRKSKSVGTNSSSTSLLRGRRRRFLCSSTCLVTLESNCWWSAGILSMRWLMRVSHILRSCHLLWTMARMSCLKLWISRAQTTVSLTTRTQQTGTMSKSRWTLSMIHYWRTPLTRLRLETSWVMILTCFGWKMMRNQCSGIRVTTSSFVKMLLNTSRRKTMTKRRHWWQR